MADPTIHLRPAGQPWQVLGQETYRGLVPSNVRVESDAWGWATTSFALPRDPFLPQPDLSSFVPCVIEEAGARLFEGKVMETPSRGDPDRGITVQGRGMQYALDENPIEYAWVHSDMSQWKDVRSIPGYDATYWTPQGTVTVGDGRVTMGKPQGVPYAAGQAEGVFIDMGPRRRVSRIELVMNTTVAASTQFAFYARGMTVAPTFTSPKTGAALPHFGESGSEFLAASMPSDFWTDAIILHGGATGNQIPFPSLTTVSGMFKVPVRTIALFLYWISGSGTVGGPCLVTLDRIRLYTSPKYGRRHLGNLTASDVVESAVTEASVGIVAPKQSPINSVAAGFGFQNEIRQLEGGVARGLAGGGTGGAYYRMASSPGRLVPDYNDSASGSLGQSAIGPLFSDNGGPLNDDQHLAGVNSPYATFSASPRWLQSPANSFPGTAASDAHMDWTLALWFRTSTLGNSGTLSWQEYNNRIFACETVAAPTAGLFHMGAGIDEDGGVFVGVVDSVGSEHWGTLVKPGNVSPNFADGQWHLLMVFWNRQNGMWDFTVDDLSVFTSAKSASMRLLGTSGAIDGERLPNLPMTFGNRNSFDTQFTGDLAEIAWFRGEIDLAEGAHLYRAARQNLDTTLKRTMLRMDGLATTEPRTARDVINGVNVYHRWITKVGRDRQMEFRPRPTAPKYALTAAAARRFDQAALSAGEESYNRAVVAGVDGFGNPVSVERVAAHLPGTVFVPDPAVTDSNPNFDTGVTTGWSSNPNGLLSIDATTSVSAPNSMKFNLAGALTNSSAWIFHSFTGKFKRGRLYRLTFWLRPAVAYSSGTLKAYFGDMDTGDFSPVPGSWGTVGTWVQYTVDWVPRADVSGELQVFAPDSYRSPDPGAPGVAPKTFNIDSLDLRIGQNGQLDRLDDLRTMTITHNQPLSQAIGAVMGDAFLSTRYRQQLRGSIEVGVGDVVLAGSGNVVHPRYLPGDTMELLHIPSLVDPDTGAVGRDGLIVSVGYDPHTERATVAVDNQADNFAAFIARQQAASSR